MCRAANASAPEAARDPGEGTGKAPTPAAWAARSSVAVDLHGLSLFINGLFLEKFYRKRSREYREFPWDPSSLLTLFPSLASLHWCGIFVISDELILIHYY